MVPLIRFTTAWLQAVVNREEDGQGLAEYGLILTLVAVVCIGAVTAFGVLVSATWDSISF